MRHLLLSFLITLIVACKSTPKAKTQKELSDSLQAAIEFSINEIFTKENQGYQNIKFEKYDSTYLDTVKFGQIRKGIDSLYSVIDKEIKENNTHLYKLHMEDIEIRKMNLVLLHFNTEKSSATVHCGYRVKHQYKTLTEQIDGTNEFVDLNLKPIEIKTK